jgi:hypothetical protein
MHFLVTTSQHLLLLDADSRIVRRIHSGSGLYYGLCLHQGRIVAACRNRLPSKDDSGRKLERGSILFFNHRLEVEEEVSPPFPLRDLHGIASLDGSVWVTCSFDNLVAIFDTGSRSWRKWYPSPDPPEGDRDVHHFNTVAKIEDHLVLLAHNWGPSHAFFYRYPSLTLDSIRPLGVQAHNLFFVNDSLATCSSAQGVLAAESGWRLRTGGFPRGFAHAGDLTLVGLSRTATRDERSNLDAVIRVFDPGWRFMTDYVLGGVGMVLDLLPVYLQNAALSNFDPWPQVQIYDREYNLGDPGNIYVPGTDSDVESEWHAPEAGHSWTAAQDAGLAVIINPGERNIVVEASSSYPGPYVVEVRLDQSLLGKLEYSHPGPASATFALNDRPPGPARLSFRVPWLWQPAGQIPDSMDRRWLGIAICSVRIL